MPNLPPLDWYPWVAGQVLGHLATTGLDPNAAAELARAYTDAFKRHIYPTIEYGGHLTPSQRHILAVLTNVPQTAQKIARLSGHPCNSRLRTNLSHLVALGLVRRVTEGYLLP